MASEGRRRRIAGRAGVLRAVRTRCVRPRRRPRRCSSMRACGQAKGGRDSAAASARKGLRVGMVNEAWLEILQGRRPTVQAGNARPFSSTSVSSRPRPAPAWRNVRPRPTSRSGQADVPALPSDQRIGVAVLNRAGIHAHGLVQRRGVQRDLRIGRGGAHDPADIGSAGAIGRRDPHGVLEAGVFQPQRGDLAPQGRAKAASPPG